MSCELAKMYGEAKISFVNKMLEDFNRKFASVLTSEQYTASTRLIECVSLLMEYHLQVAGDVQDMAPVRIVLHRWAMTATNDSNRRLILEMLGISQPYALGYLYGMGLEPPMARQFAKKLKTSDFYRPTLFNPGGRELPIVLRQFVS